MTDDLTRGDEGQDANVTEAAETVASETGAQATQPGTPMAGAEGAAAMVGQPGETVVVTRPAPGQTVEIQAAAGQTYVLSFPPGQAQVQVQGENFILGFDDNGDGTPDSQVVFLDLVTVADSGEAPTFQVAGVDIGSEVLLGQALALAGQEDGPLTDVAAGPGGLSGGASTYSDDLGSILELLVGQGVIPPTVLEFGLLELEDRIDILQAEELPPLLINEIGIGVAMKIPGLPGAAPSGGDGGEGGGDAGPQDLSYGEEPGELPGYNFVEVQPTRPTR